MSRPGGGVERERGTVERRAAPDDCRSPLVEPVEQRGARRASTPQRCAEGEGEGRGRGRRPGLRWRLRRRNGRRPLFAEKDRFLEAERAIEGAAPARVAEPERLRPAPGLREKRKRRAGEVRLAICADGQEPPFAGAVRTELPAGQPRSDSQQTSAVRRAARFGADALGSSPFRLCGARGQPGTAKAGANRSNSAAEGGTWAMRIAASSTIPRGANKAFACGAQSGLAFERNSRTRPGTGAGCAAYSSRARPASRRGPRRDCPARPGSPSSRAGWSSSARTDRRGTSRARERRAPGSGARRSWPADAWSRREKYQGLRAGSACDSGMVSVDGRRNASG